MIQETQYDESWALPASAAVLAVALVLYLVLLRRSPGVQNEKSRSA